MGIPERVRSVLDAIAAACDACGRAPEEVALLPISKRHPASAIREVLDLGLATFGENRVQELLSKDEEFRGTALSWHMIGSVQSNKVAALVGVEQLTLVHTLDRVKLANGLQKELASVGRRLPVLLQLHATGEAEKHGVAPVDAPDLVRHVVANCPALDLQGVMAMGPREGDPAPVFQLIARTHEELRQQTGLALPVRSLGMTGDLDAAVAAGSTLVRVGTGVFGPR